MQRCSAAQLQKGKYMELLDCMKGISGARLQQAKHSTGSVLATSEPSVLIRACNHIPHANMVPLVTQTATICEEERQHFYNLANFHYLDKCKRAAPSGPKQLNLGIAFGVGKLLFMLCFLIVQKCCSKVG